MLACDHRQPLVNTSRNRRRVLRTMFSPFVTHKLSLIQLVQSRTFSTHSSHRPDTVNRSSPGGGDRDDTVFAAIVCYHLCFVLFVVSFQLLLLLLLFFLCICCYLYLIKSGKPKLKEGEGEEILRVFSAQGLVPRGWPWKRGFVRTWVTLEFLRS